MRTLWNTIGVAVAIALLISSSAGVAATRPRVVAALGKAKVQGIDVIVEVLAVVFPGEDPQDVARAALAAQGARPFESAKLGSDGFTVTGLVWDGVPVIQNYNPENEPSTINGGTALTNTHAAWDGVATSFFDIDSGGITDRCPSLVRGCPGPQFFDGNNDVAWLRLDGRTLGVTWFSTSIDEADMALNTRFNWNDGCLDEPGSFDAETVFLHENGHTGGLGHSEDPNSVMAGSYTVAQCVLTLDDKDGATYLYDSNITGSVSGTVIDSDGIPIGGATVVLEGTGFEATTGSGGSYTISGVPDPVTYDVMASAGGFQSKTIDRVIVNGAVNVDFALMATGGGEGDVCALPLLPAGASCSDDDQCCSNKCKGKPGEKTCK